MRSLILLILATAVLSSLVPAFTGAEGGYSKSAFEKVMEGAVKDARVLLGALVAADWNKVAATGESLAEHGVAMRELTPKRNADRLADFHAHADSVITSATLLASFAEKHDRAATTAEFGKLLSVCMDCHAAFR